MKLFSVELRLSLQIEHEMTTTSLGSTTFGHLFQLRCPQVFDRERYDNGLTSHEQYPSIPLPLSHHTGWLIRTQLSHNPNKSGRF